MKTKPATPPTLGAAIRAAREARGLTRLALSRLLDERGQLGLPVDPGTIYRWERGDFEPPLSTIRELAEALGVSVTDLVR